MTTTTTKPAEAPEMPIADRLEHCAKFTGLDAVRELLIEAAAAVRKRDAVVKLLEGELQDRAQAAQAEVTGEREAFESCTLMEGSLFKRRADDPDKYWDGNVQDDWELWKARAILALRPERVPMTDEQPDQYSPDPKRRMLPGRYIIRINDDGEFGQATGWLYRVEGPDCLVSGAPVYAWRPLSDLIGPKPATAPIPVDVLVGMYDEAPTGDADMIAFARAVETHHGITAQAKKETP